MKAVVLAAGRGERLGTITNSIPKPMIVINQKPVLEHNIIMCRENGINEIIINLHHLPHVIKDYFGNGNNWGVKIEYIFEPELLGSSGTVKNIRHLLDESFFVIYGDNYFNNDIDMFAIRKFHESNRSDFTIILSLIDDISQSGVVELTDNCKITNFIEKPENQGNINNWVNAGLYFLEQRILEKIDDGYSDFGRDVIPLLIDNNYDIYGFKMKERVIPIDTPDLLENQLEIN